MDKKISSFEIVKHNNFSWSYVYTIDGRKRDIHGDSLHKLRKKVLDRGLPWDDENYPESKITKTKYDSMKVNKVPITPSSSPQYGTETFDYIESQRGGGWIPSSKKWNRKRDIYRQYDPDYY